MVGRDGCGGRDWSRCQHTPLVSSGVTTLPGQLQTLAVSLCLLACGGSAPQPGVPAPVPQLARVAVAGSLNRFAAERVMVMPLQELAAGDAMGWRGKAGADSIVRQRVDSTLESQLIERGVNQWVYPAALARSAKRNPTYLINPYSVRAAGAIRAAVRTQHQMVLEPLASQLRGLAGVSDARWALVPLDLSFVPDGASGGGARIRLALAVIDVRGSQVRWTGDVMGDAHTDYSFAAIVSAVQRAADLVVPR